MRRPVFIDARKRSAVGVIEVVALVVLLLACGASALTAADSLDSSFGQGGEVVMQPNPGCYGGCSEFFGSHANALALLSGGGVVLAGNGPGAGPDGEGGWLVRLDADGSLDSSFGQGGYVTSAPRFFIYHIYVRGREELLALGATSEGRVGVERYTTSGASEGSQGVQWLAVRGEPIEAVLDSVGRILVIVKGKGEKFAREVARFLPSGAPDLGFGSAGVAKLPAALGVAAERISIQRGDSIVVGGMTFVARLTPTGRLDFSFGEKGLTRIPVKSRSSFVLAVAPDQHILVATEGTLGGLPRRSGLVLIDYTSAGRLDRSFGKEGVARTTPPVRRGPGFVGSPQAIAFDAAGDAIVVGEHGERHADTRGGVWFLARYTRHGRDCSFGVRGLLVSSVSGGAKAVAVQPNGRIVIAGWSPPIRGGRPIGAGEAFMAARYVGGGTSRTCPEA
jgi:uncharacterized delta-60 repeat protein